MAVSRERIIVTFLSDALIPNGARELTLARPTGGARIIDEVRISYDRIPRAMQPLFWGMLSFPNLVYCDELLFRMA